MPSYQYACNTTDISQISIDADGSLICNGTLEVYPFQQSIAELTPTEKTELNDFIFEVFAISLMAVLSLAFILKAINKSTD